MYYVDVIIHFLDAIRLPVVFVTNNDDVRSKFAETGALHESLSTET